MNSKALLIVIAAALIAVAGILAVSSRETPSETTQIAAITANNVAEVETSAGGNRRAETTAEDALVTAEINETARQDTVIESRTTGNSVDNLNEVMVIRAVGDANAPVVIEEFASLTCSHCAHFYAQTYPALKEKYIDTGQVYFIYTDFPLNAPALEASVVARCLPQERYFRFVGFLFETQDKWAFDRNYSNYLKQNAKLLGLSEADYESCMQNQDIKAALANEMQTKAEVYNIDSTPTFVINGNEKIVGAQPLAAFEKLIRSELAKSTQTE